MLYSILRSPVASPEPLHIPDGFLSAPVAILAWIVTIAFIVVAVRRASREFDERMVPLMGILAAFIFAAQAFNFPVAGGTSGHFLGGALAAILLGPWPALLVMAAVIAGGVHHSKPGFTSGRCRSPNQAPVCAPAGGTRASGSGQSHWHKAIT